MNIKAMTFDTGGTVLDWHGGLVAAMSAVGAVHDLAPDSHEVVIDWRRRSMKGIVGQTQPAFNIDNAHRRTMDETPAQFGLQAFSDVERDRIWRSWHALNICPDFAGSLAALRKTLPVVSFTMLPASLDIDVSRGNGTTWDAVISCEMIGVYKPHAEAYATAARWLCLEPDQILFVACHNFDLNAARQAGLPTAFVRRPAEWGPTGPPDANPNMDYDIVVDGFTELATAVSNLH